MTPPPSGRGPSSPTVRGFDLNGLVHAWQAAGKLVSVAQLPAGLTAYACFEDDEYSITSLHLIDGHVFVRGHDTRFGDMVTGLLGTSTVEVLAHPDEAAKAAYQQHVVEVDAENRETALEQVRGMIGAVMSELGLEPVDTETADDASGENDPS